MRATQSLTSRRCQLNIHNLYPNETQWDTKSPTFITQRNIDNCWLRTKTSKSRRSLILR